jgi:hypothetical protein
MSLNTTLNQQLADLTNLNASLNQQLAELKKQHKEDP